MLYPLLFVLIYNALKLEANQYCQQQYISTHAELIVYSPKRVQRSETKQSQWLRIISRLSQLYK